MKKCSKCKLPKDENEFSPNKLAKDGLKAWCKECNKINNRRLRGRLNESGEFENKIEKGYIQDLTGQKFGEWNVLRYSHTNKHGHSFWICQCGCGREKTVMANSMKSGSSLSCGECKHEDRELAAFNQLYCVYRVQAKRRNFVFELTKKYFREITKKNCFYCDKEPAQVMKYQKGEYVYNGVDRVDSSKGYILGNVVPCCGRCNRLKSNAPQADFLLWIKRIYENLKLSMISK